MTKMSQQGWTPGPTLCPSWSGCIYVWNHPPGGRVDRHAGGGHQKAAHWSHSLRKTNLGKILDPMINLTKLDQLECWVLLHLQGVRQGGVDQVPANGKTCNLMRKYVFTCIAHPWGGLAGWLYKLEQRAVIRRVSAALGTRGIRANCFMELNATSVMLTNRF